MEAGRDGTSFRLDGKDMFVSIPGSFEAYNAQTALTALGVRFPETLPFFEEGLRNVVWPCRMEEFPGGFVVDVSHTSAGLRCMTDDLLRIYGKARVVFGMLSDKNIDEACRIISGAASQVYVTAPATVRANPAEDTLTLMRAYLPGAVACASVGEAMERASAERGAGEIVLVTGSFHMAGEALRWMGTGSLRYWTALRPRTAAAPTPGGTPRASTRNGRATPSTS